MGLECGNNKASSGNPEDKSLSAPPPPPEHSLYHQMFKRTPKMVIIFAVVALSCLVLYHSSFTFPFSRDYNSFSFGTRLASSFLLYTLLCSGGPSPKIHGHPFFFFFF
ncbi:hypothetical protein HanHA300_Chr13g0490991 [Helianthus annuus]|nr:hypothetical protein HanHA300_Chr13g0490991 [Helianthus annuus]KAJ0498483.1 hypothetical protein HanHA89_Chr13g0523121 [Helianthus annuus]KAJ0664497.1 hypothetical protein HanLR1_Chr13g0493111 [Helianthus annuus]